MTGRPTLRTPEIEIRICTALANGVPLLTQCKADDMPDPATVYAWLRDSPDFASLYATARMDGAHTLFDRALGVAEDLPLIVEREGEKVTVRVDNALVSRNKLLVHALHTAAEKLLPRVYAPKIGVGGVRHARHQGPAGLRHAGGPDRAGKADGLRVCHGEARGGSGRQGGVRASTAPTLGGNRVSPRCIAAVNAAAGRILTDTQIKAIDDEMSASMRRLARADPGRWQSLTADERLVEAGAAVVADIKARADRKLANAERQIVRQFQTSERIAQVQEALNGTRIDALKRDIVLTDHHVTAERKFAFGSLANLIETAGDNTGAGFGRKLLMAVFNTENPAMTRDVVHEIFKNADGHTTNQAAKAAARAWLDTIENLRTRFNAAGGDVGQLDYGYTPQPHDTASIRKAGPDAWATATLPLLDRSRYLLEDGTRMADDELFGLLRSVWDTLATEGLNKREPGAYAGTGARANRGSDSKQIHFADGDAWASYMAQFGRGSIYDAMMGHVSGIVRDIVLVERYGPDANGAARLQFDLALREAGGQDVGAFSISPETYWDILSGKTGTPVNETMARNFSSLRSLQVAGKVGAAVISSITDLGTLAITTGYNRLPYWRMIQDIGSQASKETRDFMATHGMVAESGRRQPQPLERRSPRLELGREASPTASCGRRCSTLGPMAYAKASRSP